MIRREVHIFFTALMFYTRIPCPQWVHHSEEMLNKATRYFPFIGWIVGGFSALIFWGMQFILPKEVSIIFSMVAGILITGAFHEDGFADVCDGFGGGWTKEKILTIMKDSRVGAFGAIGIVLMLGTKFALLAGTEATVLPFVIIASHSMSRFATASFIFTHKYVRENDDSKIKPIGKKISFGSLLVAFIFGIVPTLLLWHWVWFLILIPVMLAKELMGLYFKKWIGGYTGDCLGATQQVCEIVFYTSFLVLWKFIS